MAYNSNYSGDTIDTAIGKAKNLYPVGSIYLTIGSESPANLFGGTWERFPDGYTLWSAASGAGDTISAGLPNITAAVKKAVYAAANGGYYFWNGSGNGAFYGTDETRYQFSNNPWYEDLSFFKTLNLNASRSSSIYGNSSTVQPPAIKVYIWKRVA